MSREVLVVGAGVVGLWCARELLRAGARVRVWTRDAPLATTSAVAAAIWYPYEARPIERVLPWAMRSLACYRGLAGVEGAGVTLVTGTELTTEHLQAPDWVRGLEGFRALPEDDVPPPYHAGWRLTVPVVETPLHLAWLAREVEARGGTIERRTVRFLDEIEGTWRAIVNATGLGARELCADHDLHPIQGQVVRVPQPGLATWTFFQAPGEMGYVIPRARDVVLGGTAVHDAWSLEPDEQVTADILARCAQREPRVRGLSPTASVVGLRPGRSAVRLEAESTANGTLLVHDYGHGGAGITLSPGCAEEVRRIVLEQGSAT